MGEQTIPGGSWVGRWVMASGPMSLSRMPLLLILLLLTACDLDPDGPHLDEGPVYSLDPITTSAERIPGPVTEIFGSETDPVGSVRALAWTRSGEILLADAGRALLLLSADGDSLRTLEGSGEGPGEFRQILVAGALAEGGAVVFDPVLNRMTELTPTFEVDRLWSPEPDLGSGSLFGPMALTADGALLGVPLPAGPGGSSGSVRSSPQGEGSELWRYAPVLRVGEWGVDTVTEIAVVRCQADSPSIPLEGGGEVHTECAPDGDMAVMTSGEHGTAVAPRDWAEARVFGTGVDPLYTVRVDDPAAEPFSKVLWDDRGRLWLGHWRSPEWWVVREGEATRVELPEGFDLWDVAHDRALGVVRGPFDTQRIGVLDLPAGVTSAVGS